MTRLSDLQIRILEKQTITCTDIELLAGDYADDDLTTTLRARVDAHVKNCAECQKFHQEYSTVIKLAAELRNAPVPVEVRNRLRAKLNERLGLKLAQVTA